MHYTPSSQWPRPLASTPRGFFLIYVNNGWLSSMPQLIQEVGDWHADYETVHAGKVSILYLPNVVDGAAMVSYGHDDHADADAAIAKHKSKAKHKTVAIIKYSVNNKGEVEQEVETIDHTNNQITWNVDDLLN